jgi:hypothetical protein
MMAFPTMALKEIGRGKIRKENEKMMTGRDIGYAFHLEMCRIS